MKPQAADIRAEMAESLAIDALAYIAGEPNVLGRFLAVSGLGPSTLRRAAADPAFLAGVLDFLLGDEPLLLGFVSRAGIPPERIAQARRALSAAQGDNPPTSGQQHEDDPAGA